MRSNAPFLSRHRLSGQPGFLTTAAILIAAGNLAAQVSTSLVLSSSANPSIPGQDITLTATVSPATITGKVTFYDGTTVLGTGVLTHGTATLSTGLLASGVRSLRALYQGNALSAASAGMFAQTVNPLPQQGFGFAVQYAAGGNPQAVAVGDFNGDGKADLAVADNFGKVNVLLNPGGGIFQSAMTYTAGSGPSSVAVGDFNGDGKTDLAVTNFNDDTVSVLLGNGDGTFQPPVNYATGILPQSVAVGDFNGDGNADLAVANSASNNLSVFLGNGDGTFQTAVKYTTGAVPWSVTVGDFNEDGKADLAVANSGSGNVSVFLGAGNGTFSAAVNYAAGSGPKSVTVGVFNGHADLAIANYLDNTVSVLLGNGDGTFQNAVSYSAGNYPESVAVGDFNGDGNPDLVVANNDMENVANGNTVSVLLGSGNGTFEAAVNYGTGANPISLAVADFKGDGLEDLAVVANGVNILAGVELKGTTQPSVALESSLNPSLYGQGVTLTATVTPSAATGSITFYDGVAVLGAGTLANGAATLTTSLLSSGSHSLTALYGGDITYAATKTSSAFVQAVSPVAQNGFQTAATYPTGSNPQSIVVADFNKDGREDVATANGSINVLLGNGNGTFGTAVDYATDPDAVAIATGDLNGDGNIDIVAANVGNSSISILLGNGDGTFQAAVNWYVDSPRSPVVGDFNGDGHADIAVSNNSGNWVSILLGNGDGTFGWPINYATGVGAGAISMGDFNGDGKVDLAVTLNNSSDGGGVGILFGNGDGTFQTAVSYSIPAPGYAIAVGDFNGDGTADLAVTNFVLNSSYGAVAVLLNKGDGTFQKAVNYTVAGMPASVIAGDFNGDGKLDLAVGCQTIIGGFAADNVAILDGNGDGTFQSPVVYGTGKYPISIAAGDFNGDGRVDVVTANYYDGTISVLLGFAPSTITLSSSLSPSVYSQPVTLTATVPSPGATGFVTFYEGATILGTSTLTSGQAVFTTDLLPPGTGLLRAVYGGNAAYAVSTSAALTQTVTDTPSNGLTEASAFATGPGPQSVAVGDFNGDGIVDLAVAGGANSVSILLGNGNGTFQAAMTYAAGVSPNSVAVGDFNGDGKNDLVVANSGGSIQTLMGNGDGTFQAAVTLINQSPFEPASVAVGDFNGDGKADIVFVNALGGVGLLLGNGDGTFPNSQGYGVGTETTSVAVGDFNGDGKADLVVGNSLIGGVRVLSGNGDGTFQGATYATGSQPEAVAVGDFNGDGKLDFVVANQLSNNLSVLLNKGNGTFSAAVNYPTGQWPISVTVGDFNGDGKADLATANNFDGTVSILTGNGDGTFQPPVNYGVGIDPTSVATADFNGDGRADLAVANAFDSTVSILLGAPVSAVTTSAIELRFPFNPITYGFEETLTALVSPSTATGTVTFLDGTVSLGAVSLNNGVATLNVSAFAAGIHSLAASYGGDAKDTSSVSAAVTLTVSQSTTTIKLASSANPSTPGQSITLTATVFAPPTATGSVTFSDGLTALGTVALSGGTATLTLSTLPAGTNTLFATYSGDANDISSTVKLVQTVGQPTTTTTSISSSSNPSIYGQSLTLTATVAAPSSTGIVTFYDGTTVLGVDTLANVSASLTTKLLASGARSLKAYYGGDFSHLASLSPTVTQTVNTLPSKGFQPAVNYGAGAVPWSVVAGDFNGDGNIDLAVTNQGGAAQTGNGISVLLGKGDGTFQSALNVTTGPSPQSLVTGDFNGDGKIDLAYASSNSAQNTTSVNVLLGNGDGTFQAAASYPIGGPGSLFLVTGDFNEDGYTDLAVSVNGTVGSVDLFLGNGDGTFHAGIQYSPGGGVTAAAVGDFNRDGHADFAFTNSYGNVGILFGKGDGTFQLPEANYGVGNAPIPLSYLAVGDFNGDGISDLAVAGYVDSATPGNVYVLLGKSDGTFQAAVGYAVDILPQSIAIGDFNGDGKIDIATANGASGDVSVLLGNGDGTFQAAVAYAAGSLPQSMATADFNGDGKIDFAVANSGGNSVSVLLAGGITAQTISFGPPAYMALGAAPFPIEASASSGLTVTLASSTPATCSVSGSTVTLIATGTCSILATQPGNATYAAATPVTQSFTINPASQAIAFGALGNVSLGAASFNLSATATSGLAVTFASNTGAVCTVSGNTVTLMATGSCSITASQAGGGIYPAATPVTRSFDVTAQVSASDTLVAASGSPVSVGTGPHSTAVGDFNGDGIPDLAVANSGDGTLTVLLGDGTGGFMAASGGPFAVPDPSSVAVGDFNGDGIPDLVVANSVNGTLTVLLGNGTGGFTEAAGNPFAAGSDPSFGVVVGDFNGDGNQDLAAVGFSNTNNVTVLLGNGSGGFAAAPGSPFALGTYAYGIGAFSMVTGDFNGDGIQDLATANEFTNNVTVLLGNGSGGFTAAAGSPITVGNQPTSLAAGDFNGDGVADLAVVAQNGSATILLGSRTGELKGASGSPFTVGLYASAVAVGDFNGDGKADLAVVDQGAVDGSVTILLGNGAGGFEAASGSPFTTGAGPVSVVVGDFNGDGRLDLAAVNNDSNNITVLLGASVPTVSTTSLLSTTSPLTITADKSVPLTLTVSGAVTTFFALTGTATFLDGATIIGGAGQSPWTFTASGLSVGSHTLTATYNGDTRSLASTSNGITIQVTAPLPPQTISFAPLSDVTSGAAPFGISATASSGLPVTFTSNAPNVCTVSGTAVTIFASGGCSITASQAGNSSFAAAPPVTQDFTVFFSDISPSASYAAAVDLFAQYGITAGCGNDDFCANSPVTRAEMAVFIITGIFRGSSFGYSSTPHFSDVQPGDFGFKWIQAMYELGITAGCGGGNYCPNSSVTREEMAVFIIAARFGAGASFTYSSTPSFNDVPDSGATAPYFKFVQRMEQDGITAGCAKGLYCPDSPVTRAEMAVFMMAGLFNQFLRAGTPMITLISPSTLAAGASGTFTITGVNTSFAQGTTTLSPIPGVTIGTVMVNSPTSLTVQLTAAADAALQPYTIVAITNSEQDVLPNSLIIQ